MKELRNITENCSESLCRRGGGPGSIGNNKTWDLLLVRALFVRDFLKLFLTFFIFVIYVAWRKSNTLVFL
jgi:hypothetical protein